MQETRWRPEICIIITWQNKTKLQGTNSHLWFFQWSGCSREDDPRQWQKLHGGGSRRPQQLFNVGNIHSQLFNRVQSKQHCFPQRSHLQDRTSLKFKWRSAWKFHHPQGKNHSHDRKWKRRIEKNGRKQFGSHQWIQKQVWKLQGKVERIWSCEGKAARTEKNYRWSQKPKAIFVQIRFRHHKCQIERSVPTFDERWRCRIGVNWLFGSLQWWS